MGLNLCHRRLCGKKHIGYDMKKLWENFLNWLDANDYSDVPDVNITMSFSRFLVVLAALFIIVVFIATLINYS